MVEVEVLMVVQIAGADGNGGGGWWWCWWSTFCGVALDHC